MQNILRFIVKNHFLLLFLLLEVVALNFAISHSKLKTQRFLTSANAVSGFFNKNFSQVSAYFSLSGENDRLAKENRKLKNKLSHYNLQLELSEKPMYEPQFNYQTAEVVKNSVFKTNNFITLDKGNKDGVKTNMAVVSPSGVVGVTAKVSENYTTVVSILNTRIGLSAKLKKNDYFGSIVWDGKDYRYVTLNEIPNHVEVQNEDPVVTSGYSAIFPENIIIGTVDSVLHVTENNFFKIRVKLSADFKNLRHVYIIENKRRKERVSLEEDTKEDFKF